MPLGEHSIERPCECRAAFDDFCFFFLNSCFIYLASSLLKSLLQYKIVNASCFLEREKDRQNNSFYVRSSASHNGRIIQLLLLQLLVSCFMTPLDKTNPLFPLLLSPSPSLFVALWAQRVRVTSEFLATTYFHR